MTPAPILDAEKGDQDNAKAKMDFAVQMGEGTYDDQVMLAGTETPPVTMLRSTGMLGT